MYLYIIKNVSVDIDEILSINILGASKWYPQVQNATVPTNSHQTTRPLTHTNRP